MNQALTGTRVIDLTQVMAGPFCTMILADLGADVIKIEPPGGDLSRTMGGTAHRLRGTDNAPFLALNRNKRSVVLDLKLSEERAVLLAMVRSADVLVENFRPGVVDRLGIGYDELEPLNPGLVYASISGFGQTGPYADRPGFDLIAQGMSGVMSVTGEPGGSPVKCGVPIADLAAGLYAANGIQAALLARWRTGRGQRVETSLFQAALALSVWEAAEFFATGETPRAQGSAHRLNAPYQAFRTADGHVTLAAITARQWQRLTVVIGREGLAADPRFITNDARMEHRAALVEEIEAALAHETTAHWVERLLAAGVPAGPIQDYSQVFRDPHTHARNMVAEIEHPVEGLIRMLGFPVAMSASPSTVRRPPPLLGEHTSEVMQELGVEGSTPSGSSR